MINSDPHPSDADRGISEMTAVTTLIGVALLLVVGIGINVFLIAPTNTGPPEANFTYKHLSEGNALIVTHERGDAIRAGDLYIESEDNSATWAALAGSNGSTMVEPDDKIQVSEGGAFDAPVRTSDRIKIVWRNESINETAVLSRWDDKSAF